MEDRFDAIVVGGGLSGLAAAYTLAEAGQGVLLVERGDYAGAKNVTGGRLYVEPVRELFPKLWDKAPLERGVVHEELCVASEQGSMLMRYADTAAANGTYHSYTVLRAKFDKYFAKQAERAGATIVTKAKADELVWKDGKVDGIMVGGDELRADVVLACDGVLSLTAERAGLSQPGKPEHYAVGVKEVIELDPSVIESRFNLVGDQGAARLYMGDITKGKFGGGFLYTNKSSISIGLVLGIEDLMVKEPSVSVPDLMDLFKARPEVAALIEGGQTVEYSAHAIAEGGYKHMPKLYADGLLVCGDAAGFCVNAALTVRGMEYAMASGHYAAQAVMRAKEKGDFSAASLRCYMDLLNDSFVMKDMKTYKDVPENLNHERLFTFYPDLVVGLLHKLYDIPAGPKNRIMPTVKSALGFRTVCEVVAKDLGRIVKL